MSMDILKFLINDIDIANNPVPVLSSNLCGTSMYPDGDTSNCNFSAGGSTCQVTDIMFNEQEPMNITQSDTNYTVSQLTNLLHPMYTGLPMQPDSSSQPQMQPIQNNGYAAACFYQNDSSSKKSKRSRTSYTTDQLMTLEEDFGRTNYLTRARRIQLAQFLGLSERQIKIWFQNRRMKKKKEGMKNIKSKEDQSTNSSPASDATVSTTQDCDQVAPNACNVATSTHPINYNPHSGVTPCADYQKQELINWNSTLAYNPVPLRSLPAMGMQYITRNDVLPQTVVANESTPNTVQQINEFYETISDSRDDFYFTTWLEDALADVALI